MLASMLGLAMMLGTDVDPCTLVLAQDPQAATCEAVDSPKLTFGGLIMRNFTFSVQDNEAAPNETVGGVSFEIGPKAPTEGFYKYGVLPACVRDGELLQAGIGVANVMPGYHTRKSSDAPTSLWYAQDPCFAPAERVAVAFGGYSETEPREASVEGWADGKNTITVGSVVLTVEAVTVPEEPWTGDQSVTFVLSLDETTRAAIFREANQVSCKARLVELLGTPSDMSGVYGDWNSGDIWHGFCYVSGGNNVSIGAQHTGRTTDTVSRTFDYLDSRGAWYSVKAGASSTVLKYYPPGHALRPTDTDAVGFDHQAVLLDDSVLDDLVYNPMAPDIAFAPGQCTDFECVNSYCGQTSVTDLLEWAKCLVAMDVDWGDYATTMHDNLLNLEPYAAIEHGLGLMVAWPTASARLTGQCGVLGDLSSTALAGVTLDTCALPHADIIRRILAVFIGLVFGSSVLGMFHAYFTKGRVGPAQAGD